MIVSENSKPSVEEFKSLMNQTDAYLNNDASNREEYYISRDGSKLEEDVCSALKHCSTGTPFEGSITLVSGAKFPDIVAHKYYGVEVKSTIKNQWKSIGSSILESTRIPEVERIYLTFGKLGKPVQFKSRPYEEVMSGISVTHYPRYQIDMELSKGNTIFDKIGVPYDELRVMDNPVTPVTEYYRKNLKKDQTLWWASDGREERITPPVIRFWSSLTTEQRQKYISSGFVYFPEILGISQTKYQQYAWWLVNSCSIICANIRDEFTAGGKKDVQTITGIFESMPAVFARIKRNHEFIEEIINNSSVDELKEFWQTDKIFDNRIEQWCRVASKAAAESPELKYQQVYTMLCGIFCIKPEL